MVEKEAGIGGNILSGVLLGAATVFGMLFMKSFFPVASFIVPRVPTSIATTFRGFMIIVVAPVFEEPVFRKVIYERLVKRGWSKVRANWTQSFLFGIFHSLVYGLILGQLNTFIEAFGVFPAIGGSIFAATVFGFGMRKLVDITARNGKPGNLLPSIIAHGGLNAAIFLSLSVTTGTFNTILTGF